MSTTDSTPATIATGDGWTLTEHTNAHMREHGWYLATFNAPRVKGTAEVALYDDGGEIVMTLNPSRTDDRGNTVYDSQTHQAIKDNPVTINGVAMGGRAYVSEGTEYSKGQGRPWFLKSGYADNFTDAGYKRFAPLAFAIRDALASPVLLARKTVEQAARREARAAEALGEAQRAHADAAETLRAARAALDALTD